MPTYILGEAGGGYFNNRGLNNPPYSFGTKITVPNGQCWLVRDVTIQMAGNGSSETVYGHIWDKNGSDYWQGSGVLIASDTSAPFGEKNLGDPGSTRLLNNVNGTNDFWYVGFSKSAADSINWDVEGASGTTNGTATGDAANGNLNDFSPTAALARNIVGTFVYTLVTVPDAPSLSASGGNGQVSLSWTLPDDGGVAISGYTLKRGATTIYSGTNRSFVDTGRADGTTYSYTVTATNGVGTSAADSASATTYDVPGTPVPTATAGIRQVTVTFPAVSNGGLATVNYQYSLDNVNWSSNITSGHVITGLANNTSYTVRVRASNAVGTSATGTAAAVTTPSLPTNPTSLNANTSTFGVIGLSWVASNGDGYPVTYTIRRDGNTLGTTSNTTFNDNTVAPSVAYTYTVTASTDVGSSGAASVNTSSIGGIVRISTNGSTFTAAGLAYVCTNTAGAQVWTPAQVRIWNGTEWKYGI